MTEEKYYLLNWSATSYTPKIVLTFDFRAPTLNLKRLKGQDGFIQDCQPEDAPGKAVPELLNRLPYLGYPANIHYPASEGMPTPGGLMFITNSLMHSNTINISANGITFHRYHLCMV